MQDIYRLQAFVAVVDEGSLSAAVSKLHITQPALSTRLKLLEDSLGCLLLERTGRGVRPTPMGNLLYGIAVDILKRMEHLQVTFKNHLELRDGWIHLGGGATAVAGVFPDAIQAFRSRFPDVQFTLQEQDSKGVSEALRQGAVDLGIVTGQSASQDTAQAPEGLKVHGIITDELCLIASPRNELALLQASRAVQGATLKPADVRGLALILFDEGSAIRALIDAQLNALNLAPRVIMTLRSPQSMLRMVEKDIGLSVVSKLAMHGGEDVSVLAVEGLDMRRNLLIVSAADRSLTPAAEAFLGVLLNGVGDAVLAQKTVSRNDL